MANKKTEKSTILTGLDLFHVKSGPAQKSTQPLIPVQEALVIKGVMEGKRPGQAVQDAGYGFNAKNAKVFGEKLIKKHTDLNGELTLSAERIGVTPDAIMQVIKDGMSATKPLLVAKTKAKDSGFEEYEYEDRPDHQTRLKAIEPALDILPGARAAKKVEITQTTFEQKAVITADISANPAEVMMLMQNMLEKKRIAASE